MVEELSLVISSVVLFSGVICEIVKTYCNSVIVFNFSVEPSWIRTVSKYRCTNTDINTDRLGALDSAKGLRPCYNQNDDICYNHGYACSDRNYGGVNVALSVRVSAIRTTSEIS